MKLPLAAILALSLASFTCVALAAAPESKPTSNATKTFACGDSLPRADGTRSAGKPCNIASEYCYEATGGAPISHGAECRPLPKPGATCADLIAGIAGAACTGTAATGQRVQFTFP